MSPSSTFPTWILDWLTAGMGDLEPGQYEDLITWAGGIDTLPALLLSMLESMEPRRPVPAYLEQFLGRDETAERLLVFAAVGCAAILRGLWMRQSERTLS